MKERIQGIRVKEELNRKKDLRTLRMNINREKASVK